MRRYFSKAAGILVLMILAWTSTGDACIGERGEVPAFRSKPVLREKPILIPEGLPGAGRALVSVEPTLVILVQFTDRAGITTQANWNTEMFAAANSMRDYYQEVSYYVAGVTGLDLPPASETSAPNNNGVAGWYTITYTDNGNTYDEHPWNEFGANWLDSTEASRWIAKAAVLAADPHVNFAAFDANGNGFISAKELHIVVVVAGYEDSYSGSPNPATWRHHWSLATGVTVDGKVVLQGNQGGGYSMVGELRPNGSIIKFGLVSHEMGHDLGLPDLYDTDDDNGKSEGIGDWGLMGSGDWCKVTVDADSPSHLCAWSKIHLGWISPIVIHVDQSNVPITQVETTPVAYKLRSGGQPETEHFLVTNRQRVGYDAGLVRSGSAHGLLIWHIDEETINATLEDNEVNGNEECKGVDLECADGAAGHVPNADELDAETDCGDATDPWYLGNDADFHAGSAPDNRDYRHCHDTGPDVNTAVEVRDISASGNPMRADLKVGKAVPTLSGWGIIALVILIVISSVWFFKRRERLTLIRTPYSK